MIESSMKSKFGLFLTNREAVKLAIQAMEDGTGIANLKFKRGITWAALDPSVKYGLMRGIIKCYQGTQKKFLGEMHGHGC